MVTVRTFRGGTLISRARALIASLLLALPVILLAVPSLLLGASGEKVVVLSEKGRSELNTTVRGAAELLPIAQVVSGLGVTLAPDPRGLSLTLTAQGREVVVYDRKSLASVGGDLRLLSSPVVGEEGRWLVPVDSLPRLLQPLLGKRIEWRAATRVLSRSITWTIPRWTRPTSLLSSLISAAMRLVWAVSKTSSSLSSRSTAAK